VWRHTDRSLFCFAAVFPGLVESIDAKDYTNAVRWADIIEDCITTATANIKVGYHG
jgi:N-acetylated-alpha-linked acidic dipeptidase